MADEKFELDEKQLDQLSGGGSEEYDGYRVCDSRGRVIGHVCNGRKRITFVPCDKCHRPMHCGIMGWWCDPCDRHLCHVNWYEWNGTEEELIAAAP